MKAALACPVSCDSCAIGMCFKPASNELAACDGDGQVRREDARSRARMRDRTRGAHSDCTLLLLVYPG